MQKVTNLNKRESEIIFEKLLLYEKRRELFLGYILQIYFSYDLHRTLNHMLL